MNACDKCQATAVALFDNEAGDEDLRLVAGHLHDCPECRAFCLDLVTVRRTWATAPTPSPSPALRQKVFDGIQADRAAPARVWPRDRSGPFRFGRLARWAAVLVIGGLVILSVGLNREAQGLRDRLQAAERQVASLRAEDQVKETQEKQQKAISALYFRMAELEERVHRGSPSQRTSFPSSAYDHSARESNL
jgi:hypothetical protein